MIDPDTDSWAKRKRILLTGATGMIASALHPFLTQRGWQVTRLSRSGSDGTLQWDPAAGRLDVADIEGFDAVVHLAGASLADRRWTDKRKKLLHSSRIDSTQLLVSTLANASSPPRIVISASAIGYYGNTGSREVDESGAASGDFLGRLCRDWESEALMAAELFGARVITLRMGIVLSASGGALARMLPPFRLGVGGRLGQGSQWMSWIALNDLLQVIETCLTDNRLHGPVNAVAPEPVRNADFSASLASALGRPCFLPVPASLLKLAFGELAQATLLSNSRVLPMRLSSVGHAFQCPTLEEAFGRILQTNPLGE